MISARTRAGRAQQVGSPTWVPRRVLAQPLLHFVVIGGLVFVAFAWLDDAPPSADAGRIVVGEARVRQFADGFEAVWRRRPTAGELVALVDAFVREEIYVREALALGLDRDDTVIRRRLAQKMEFLTASVADTLEPSEAELRAFFAEHEARFTTEPRVGFDQVFLGDAPSAADVAEIRAALDRGVAHERLGERTLLPASLPPSPPNVVDGTFGSGVFETLVELEPGAWVGPVVSAYGSHLVRLTEREPARRLPFDAVRPQVEAEWRRARAEALEQERFENLRARYEIVRPDEVAW